MVAPRRVIALPSDARQRQRLLEISRSRTEPTGRVERARIILAYLQDPSAYAVARSHWIPVVPPISAVPPAPPISTVSTARRLSLYLKISMIVLLVSPLAYAMRMTPIIPVSW